MIVLPLSLVRCLLGSVLVAGVATLSRDAVFASEPSPASLVDYLNSLGKDSSPKARATLFAKQWPNEEYKQSAEQNTKLLKHLLAENKQALVPMPSKDVKDCAAFYSNPEVAKYLTAAFQSNATKACWVTGTGVAQAKIREELQKTYAKEKPADGKTFTAEEHKRIHDAAYKAAGCKEDSAKLWGWYVVNKADVPAPVVDLAIKTFGKCTISGD